MRIAMIGTGYVGLVSGVCLSDFGHDVISVDKSADKIAMLNAGEVPIYEPGLDDLMERNVRAGRLSFTTDLTEAVKGADAIFIAVGTPARRGDGHADLSCFCRRKGNCRGADRLRRCCDQIHCTSRHQSERA